MWIVFAALAALLAAIAVTFTKAGVGNVDPVLAFAIQGLFIVTISWGVVFFQKNAGALAQIDKKAWLFISLAGVATCLSSIFQFSALKMGDASATTAVERSSLVFTVLLAWFFFKEHLSWKTLLGIAMILGGVLIITLSRKQS